MLKLIAEFDDWGDGGGVGICIFAESRILIPRVVSGLNDRLQPTRDVSLPYFTV
jgi:hypothetical protein